MAKVQYALCLAAAAPYHRLLRFTDGVASKLPDLPTAAPAALSAASFSPDGKYVIAGKAAAGAAALKFWKSDAADSWKEIALPNVANALTTITAIAFVTNRHIAYSCSQTGVWFGVLDRTTDTIVWTNLTTGNYLGIAVEKRSDGDAEWFCAYRVNATNYGAFYKIVNDVATFAYNPSTSLFPQTSHLKFDWDNKLIWGVWPANAFGDYCRLWNRDTPIIANSGFVFANIDASNRGLAAVARQCIAVSKDCRKVFASIDAGTRLTTQRILNLRNARDGIGPGYGTTNGVRRVFIDDEPTITPLAAMATEIENVGDDKLIVSIGSATVSTGRIRVFKILAEDLAEDIAARDLFADFNSAFVGVAVSKEYEIGASASLYTAALESLVGRTGDLANLKIALLGNGATFDASHTAVSQVIGANEIYSTTDWPQGGIKANAGTWRKVGTQYAFDLTFPFKDVANNITLTWRKAVIYDDTSKVPLMFFNFGTDQTAKQFDRMTFSFASNDAVLFTASA